MPVLVVTFTSIDVHDDADNFSEGEIYYDMRIGETSIVSRSRDNTQDIDSGGVIQLNAQRTLSRPDNDSNAFLQISGSVSEQDSGLTFEDDHAGSFTHIHNQANNWGIGTNDARLTGDGLDVTVHYTITSAVVDPNL